MMEVLRRLAQSDVKLQNNIIFLFNGAEENMLQVGVPDFTVHFQASLLPTDVIIGHLYSSI